MTVESHQGNHRLYTLTRQYIEHEMLVTHDINPAILKTYLQPVYQIGQLTLNGIYECVLDHAKNKGMGKNAIEGIFGDGWEDSPNEKRQKWGLLKELLFDFDPHQVFKTFTIYDFFLLLGNAPFHLAEPSTPVYGFCRSIISGARYLSRFENGKGFYDHFSNISQEQARDELQTISGYGEALPFDLLKDLGYVQYVKPDVHTMEIAFGLGLIADPSDARATIHALQAISLAVGETPFSLDRMFWLIGSGNFFNNTAEDIRARQIWSSKSHAKKRRQQFIAYIHLSTSGSG